MKDASVKSTSGVTKKVFVSPTDENANTLLATLDRLKKDAIAKLDEHLAAMKSPLVKNGSAGLAK